MNIDLGRKMGEGVKVPVNRSDETIYPSLYIEGGAELGQLPSEGTLTIRYRTCEKTLRDREGGNAKVRLELEVQAIEGAKAGDAKPAKSREQTIDDLAKEVMGDDDGDE